MAGFLTVCVMALVLAWPAKAVVSVTYEMPGVQQSTASFDILGVETFDEKKKGSGQKMKTDFGTDGAIVGRYSGLQVDGASQYGSAGGKGNHAASSSTDGYTLDLSTSDPGGITYFGFWLSALDGNNQVTLRSAGKDLFIYTPVQMLAALAGETAYFGNPNAPFLGKNAHEPYAFVNFFSDVAFDQVQFRQARSGGGHESDNHSVGRWLTQSGSQVPEVKTWVMLISGFALVGLSLRRRRPDFARVTG